VPGVEEATLGVDLAAAVHRTEVPAAAEDIQGAVRVDGIILATPVGVGFTM